MNELSLDSLKKLIDDKVIETLDKASKIYNRQFPIPNIRYNLKGMCAGQANYCGEYIRINTELAILNKNEYINRTVPHEIGHIISCALYGNFGKGHKTAWKSVMEKLGYSGMARCHNYDVSQVKTQNRAVIKYKCGCREHLISKCKHNRILHGVIYICNTCKGKLVKI